MVRAHCVAHAARVQPRRWLDAAARAAHDASSRARAAAAAAGGGAQAAGGPEQAAEVHRCAPKRPHRAPHATLPALRAPQTRADASPARSDDTPGAARGRRHPQLRSSVLGPKHRRCARSLAIASRVSVCGVLTSPAAPRCRQGVRGVGEPDAAGDHNGLLRLHLEDGAGGRRGIRRRERRREGAATKRCKLCARAHAQTRRCVPDVRCAVRLLRERGSRCPRVRCMQSARSSRKGSRTRAAQVFFRWISPRARHGGARARPAASGRQTRPPRAAPRVRWRLAASRPARKRSRRPVRQRPRLRKRAKGGLPARKISGGGAIAARRRTGSYVRGERAKAL